VGGLGIGELLNQTIPFILDGLYFTPVAGDFGLGLGN